MSLAREGWGWLFDHTFGAETKLSCAWRWFNENDVLATGHADRRLIRCAMWMDTMVTRMECESSLPRITLAYYTIHVRVHAACTRMISSPSRILARVRVHAFISLSLKATVNIWIIKPPPSPSSSLSSPPVTLCWDVFRLMVDEVGEERNAMEREVRRHRYNSYGTNKGDPEQRRMQEINPP